MTTAIRTDALTADEEKTLDFLALSTPPGDGMPLFAAAMASATLTDREQGDAWEAFQEAVLIREALGTQERMWFEYKAEYALPPGPCKQEAAIHLAGVVADEARNHFVNGGPS